MCDFKLSRIIEKEIERGGGPAVGSTQNNPLKADLSYLVSNKYTTNYLYIMYSYVFLNYIR